MAYLSTRDGRAPPERLPFEDALLAGLAPDGGLYVPEKWPQIDAATLKGKSYVEIACAVMEPFIEGMMTGAAWQKLVAEAYTSFTHQAVAPLKQLDRNLWLLELFHGPTLAFKDYALQLLGPLFDHVLARRGERVTIVGATSGDTGSAAIEACRDRKAIDIFILYPHNRISEVQRRQMTSVASANVHTMAVEGTFDDCQDLVKAMFADAQFRHALNLSAVNSINWARIMAQVVYYFAAGVALGAPERAVSFSVPTGNFGNVYAAHVARRMGLPIAQLIIGTNRNDILARFINDGRMTIGAVEPSLSPAMDIQVSSNFERLYFELAGRDGGAVADAFGKFRSTGTLPASQAVWREARTLFAAHRVDDAGILATIKLNYRATGEIIDPHSAVALAAAQALGRKDAPMVTLAAAHPAKFADAVERAVGFRPAPPERLAQIMNKPERISVLPNELAAIERFVRERARQPQEVAKQ